ncbi:hypothetical protein PV328_011961 [Microctonus aethiopoides]|uniref:Mutator-like transposase domain-containing protein n=1 Tax=Microctonus aethiopoides TaxID=144406 RepID=A0AA39FH53_9HYME|nr:hypothetical protein PV328_011961 [Microctonus aethiopoides]
MDMKAKPPHLNESFLIPNLATGYTYENINEINDKGLLKLQLRIFVLYDMGWTTKASGRHCDKGISVDKHECRKNFEGTAKAMEPYAAAKLVCENVIFKDKSVVSELYRLKKLHKELNGTSISFLQKCFNYVVSQCGGDSETLAASLKNIPYHCFNLHNNCGDWCKFHKNPDTYTHSTIREGFKGPRLLEALKCLFDLLSSKAKEFAASVSTNLCENMNAIIASHAPKSRLYKMSASGSYRTSCGMNSKNEGIRYLVHMKNNLKLHPEQYNIKHATTKDYYRKRKHEKSSTVEAKKGD